MMKEKYDEVTGFVEDLPSDISRISLCGSSYNDVGGVARVIEQQATALRDAGYTVEINALELDREPPEGVTAHEIGWFETTPYKELDKLLALVTPAGLGTLRRLRSTDLVIAHRFPFSVMGYLASRLGNAEYVFWSHPSQSSDDLFEGIAAVWARLQHHLETRTFTVTNADHLVAVSEASKSYIESHSNRDAIVVPNAVPDSRFSTITHREAIEERFDIDPEDIVVLHVGRISPRKNLEKLVESFEKATTNHPNAKLLLVGEQSMDKYIGRIRDAASEQVTLTGFVEDEVLAGIYDRSDVYATCSLSEGWGLPLSEAAAFEVSIVAFDSIPAIGAIDIEFPVPEEDYDAFIQSLRASIENVERGEA